MIFTSTQYNKLCLAVCQNGHHLEDGWLPNFISLVVISGSHALYLIFNITLCNVNLFLIQGANKVVVVVVVVVLKWSMIKFLSPPPPSFLRCIT